MELSNTWGKENIGGGDEVTWRGVMVMEKARMLTGQKAVWKERMFVNKYTN